MSFLFLVIARVAIVFKRKVLFRGHDISEELCPAKVDTRRCHVLDTKVDL